MNSKYPVFLFLLLLRPPPYVAAQTADHSEGHSGIFTPITILIIIITVVFFLTGAVAVFIRHLSDGCLGLYAATAAGGLPAARGLDTATINSIPTYLYSDIKVHRIGKVELECAVCLCEFEDSEELRLLPGCCHVFHRQCIDPWLASHVTCPICRQSLLEPESGTLRAHTVIYIPTSQTESNGLDQAMVEPDTHHDDDDHDELSCDDYHEKKEVVGKFTRSHSTGHSLADAERFTIKLPDGVPSRKVCRSENGGGPLNSMVSPRNEYRRTGWFSMTPPIILPRPGWACPPIPAGLNMVNGSKNWTLSPVRTSDRLWPI